MKSGSSPKKYHDTSSQDALSQLKQAEETEARLSRALKQKSSSDVNAQTLRLRLCELYANVLITSPAVGQDYDIPNKMWRSCFYRRIGECRARLAALNKNVTTDGKNVQARKESTMKAYRVFLREGIQFYEYIIQQYRDKLEGHERAAHAAELQRRRMKEDKRKKSQSNKKKKGRKGQKLNESSRVFGGSSGPMSQAAGSFQYPKCFPQDQPDSQDMSDGSSNNNEDMDTDTSADNDDFPMPQLPEGVILSLHRFLICIGDLHRYSSQNVESADKSSNSKQTTIALPDFAESEKNYTSAALLVPGNGNPYNQLAVLAQHRHQDAIAMYWYARALIAEEPFDITASPNLSRLLRTVVKSFTPLNISDIVATSFESVPDKKISNRPAATKRILSEFVFLQGKLYFGTTSTCDSVEKFISYLNGWCSRLKEILKENILGDALLIKLAGVLIYSVITGGIDTPKTVKSDIKISACSVRSGECFLAIAGTFRVMAILCEQASRAVAAEKLALLKANQSCDVKGRGKHLKVLAPLVIFFDFFLFHISTVLESYEVDSQAAQIQLCAKEQSDSQELFLDMFCVLMNELNSSLDFRKIQNQALSENRLLKERSAFVGFLPLKDSRKADVKTYFTDDVDHVPDDVAFEIRISCLAEFAHKMTQYDGNQSILMFSQKDGYLRRPVESHIPKSNSVEFVFPHGVDLAAAQERNPEHSAENTQVGVSTPFDEDDDGDDIVFAGDLVKFAANQDAQKKDHPYLSLSDLNNDPKGIIEDTNLNPNSVRAMMPPPGFGSPPPGFDLITAGVSLGAPRPTTNNGLSDYANGASSSLLTLLEDTTNVSGPAYPQGNNLAGIRNECIPTANPFADNAFFGGFDWPNSLGNLQKDLYDVSDGKLNDHESVNPPVTDALFSSNHDLVMPLNTYNPFFFSVP